MDCPPLALVLVLVLKVPAASGGVTEDPGMAMGSEDPGMAKGLGGDGGDGNGKAKPHRLCNSGQT